MSLTDGPPETIRPHRPTLAERADRGLDRVMVLI